MLMDKEKYQKAQARVAEMSPLKDGMAFQLRRMALAFESDFQNNPEIGRKAKRKLELQQIAAAMVLAKGGYLSCTDDEAAALELIVALELAAIHEEMIDGK